MSRKLKVGVIGCCPDLRAHLPFFHLPADRAEIVAVADHDPEMIKKSKEDKDETSLTLPSTTATVPEKPKTQYCAYCGVALETGSDKCKVCGARNDKA